MDEAFSTLRNYGRSHNRRLADVAHEVISGALAASALDLPPPVHSDVSAEMKP
jgi:hypothetical protein